MAAANKGNKPRVRSIRFAAGHDAEGSQSHVHFDEKLHDSVVMVTQEGDSSFLVKVGFLKILHRYEITFTLPPVHRLSKDVHEAPVPSLYLKLLSVVPTSEGYSVKCEYSAHKEGTQRGTATRTPALQTGTTAHPCCWTVSSAWAPSWNTTLSTATGMASTEAGHVSASEPLSLKPRLVSPTCCVTVWLPRPSPGWAWGWSVQGPPSWGLARASHLCLHLCHHPASPASSSPTSSSLCASVSCREKWMSPQGSCLRKGGGGAGVGSTHSPPQAIGAPARVWERTELAL
uniref:Adipose-secreted signaling protein n=1 Tax=Prolemur simus TaxID=1328070 RepID=A0A8C8ZP17_PROSS